MDRIARASTDERRLVFEAAAQRMALAPAVVEKDFWVCYTMDSAKPLLWKMWSKV